METPATFHFVITPENKGVLRLIDGSEIAVAAEMRFFYKEKYIGFVPLGNVNTMIFIKDDDITLEQHNTINIRIFQYKSIKDLFPKTVKLKCALNALINQTKLWK